MGGERLIQPEIAARYGLSEATIRLYRRRPEWPAPAGKRGRHAEFDAGAVDAAVRAIRARPSSPAGDADPAELLDMRAAAAEAGISYGTLRGYVSRGDWPGPDDQLHGVRRWRRSTVRARVALRRPYRRNEAHSG